MKRPGGCLFIATAAYAITIISISCNFSPKAKASVELQSPTEEAGKSELEFLKSTNGKLPKEDLLDDSTLVHRLRAMMNDRYDFLRRNWAGGDSIVVQDNFLIASGCETQKCKHANFIIVIDFYKDVVYAGIRQDRYVETFSEDGSTNPEIIRWKMYDPRKDTVSTKKELKEKK